MVNWWCITWTVGFKRLTRYKDAHKGVFYPLRLLEIFLSYSKVILLWSITTCPSSLFRTGPVWSKQSAYLSCCLWRQRRICVEWREYNKGIEYVSVQTVSSMFLVPICVTILHPTSQLTIFTQFFPLFTKEWKFNTVSSDIMLVSLTPTGYTMFYEQVNTVCTVQLKCDGTRWRTAGEVKGKLANEVGSQYPSHYLGTWCIQHYYPWCAYLGCQSTELTPPPI